MLVIEGKSQKSLKIQELSKQWDEKTTLYVDNMQGLRFLENIIYIYSTRERNIDRIIEDIYEICTSKDFYKKLKRVVLYLNIEKSELDKIKEFEDKLKKYNKDFIECVITVQSEENLVRD